MLDDATPLAPWIGLAVALGCGLLVGLERERRKGQGPQRAAAGLRSFALVTLAGAMAQTLAPGLLVAVGALAVALLAGLSYWITSRPDDGTRDPGLTTEVALLVAYLVGVQCAVAPALGAACGVVLALLLAGRARMHHFAVEWLTEMELHDALVLAGVALIVVPLVPAERVSWLGGLAPRTAASLVLLILLLQATAHVAQRLLGEHRALALSGLLGGFVSSTATIATLGAGSRRLDPPARRAAAGAAAMSGVATWAQTLAICAVVNPQLLGALAVPVAAGLVVALVGGALLLRGRDAADAAPVHAEKARPLRLREALLVAVLLLGVSALVSAAQSQFGLAGVQAGTALAALADAHSPIASVLALQQAGSLDRAPTIGLVLLAVSVNTMLRCFVAGVAGGTPFAWRVGSVLTLSALAGWAVQLAFAAQRAS